MAGGTCGTHMRRHGNSVQGTRLSPLTIRLARRETMLSMEWLVTPETLAVLISTACVAVFLIECAVEGETDAAHV